MDEREWLAERFEGERPRLRAVAHRLLGSPTEADDAVQEAWLRLSGVDAGEIESLGAWLMFVVGRVALNMLRARKTRREEPLDDPLVAGDAADPEAEALLVESVGLALVVVLETLSAAQRIAFVLHDMFAMPFEEVGSILRCSPEAARQHASRARRQLRAGGAGPSVDPVAQRRAAEAFLAAARQGDFNALLAVLDPVVVLRAVEGPGRVTEVRGAKTVARQAVSYAQPGLSVRPALIDGAPGWIGLFGGTLVSAGSVTVRSGRIVTMDIMADPGHLHELEITFAASE